MTQESRDDKETVMTVIITYHPLMNIVNGPTMFTDVAAVIFKLWVTKKLMKKT
jgi:hypothetical protein